MGTKSRNENFKKSGTKITKIWDQKFENLRTKITKIRKQITKIWEQKLKI
jgi:hypothetical protein